jgi:hypothetical protein
MQPFRLTLAVLLAAAFEHQDLATRLQQLMGQLHSGK